MISAGLHGSFEDSGPLQSSLLFHWMRVAKSQCAKSFTYADVEVEWTGLSNAFVSFKSVKSHWQLWKCKGWKKKINFINWTAQRHEVILCFLLLEGMSRKLQKEKTVGEMMSVTVSPMFMWKKSKCIRGKFFFRTSQRKRTLRSTKRILLVGRGPLKSWLFWLEHILCVFPYYDTSAVGSRKCLVPNEILYWIQFMSVSMCSGDLWLHGVQRESCMDVSSWFCSSGAQNKNEQKEKSMAHK